MATKNIAVFGIYRSQSEVKEAVDAFLAAGYRAADISVLFPHNRGTKDLVYEKHTKAPEGGAVGASTGLTLGGALGFLSSIGALAIPGLGAFIAAGPIVAALAGAGAGAALGGFLGALMGMGVPEYEAKRYEGRVRAGGLLMSVHCDNSDWAGRAKKIMRDRGAEDIGSATEARADFMNTEKPINRP